MLYERSKANCIKNLCHVYGLNCLLFDECSQGGEQAERQATKAACIINNCYEHTHKRKIH